MDRQRNRLTVHAPPPDGGRCIRQEADHGKEGSGGRYVRISMSIARHYGGKLALVLVQYRGAIISARAGGRLGWAMLPGLGCLGSTSATLFAQGVG